MKGITNEAFPFLSGDLRERFLAKIQFSDGCWGWSAGCSGDGYGAFKVFGKQRASHRVAWEWQNGISIPAGLQIDHLCRNPKCVNPNHMEVVTPKVNNHRGTSPIAKNVKKERCLRGHMFDAENTFVVRLHGRVMGRGCRICHRLRALRHEERKKTA
jgi:hypothetical protein